MTTLAERAALAAGVLDREGQLRLLGDGEWPPWMSETEVFEARARFWSVTAYLLATGRLLHVVWALPDGGALVTDYAGVTSPN